MSIRSLLSSPSGDPTALPLSRETSLYLDAARFFAAMIVFLGHFSMHPISGGAFWQFSHYGHDAVIVFFVLSGFVIAHATSRSEHTLRTYVANRAARIYSVALPAIAIGLLCDLIGSRIDPHYESWAYSDGSTWLQLATSLTFTNQFWTASYFPGSNLPYWSLGYEVPYYAMFACALYLRGVWRIVIPAILLIAAGPSIAALLPLWLAGVAMYRLGRRWRASEPLGWALVLGSIALWGSVEAWLFVYHDGAYDLPLPYLTQERLPTDCLTGICFALSIIGFEAIAHRFATVLAVAARAIRWAAARTFTLYLLHYPAMKLWAACLGARATTWPGRVAILAATTAMVLIAAHLFECRKAYWRRLVEDLMQRRSVPPLGTAPLGESNL